MMTYIHNQFMKLDLSVCIVFPLQIILNVIHVCQQWSIGKNTTTILAVFMRRVYRVSNKNVDQHKLQHNFKTWTAILMKLQEPTFS